MTAMQRLQVVCLVVACLLASQAQGQAPAPQPLPTFNEDPLGNAPTPTKATATPAPVIAPAGAEASAPATPTLAPGTCVSTAETSLPQVSVPWSSLGLIIESPDLPLNDSLVAKQVSGNDPEQIHLAIGASVEEMYVIWVSGNATLTNNGSLPAPPTINPTIVTYGTSPSSLTSTVSGDGKYYTQTYAANYTYDYNYTSPVIHTAKMTGLSANTTYHYQVGDGSSNSSVLSFRTGPPTGNSSFPVRFYTSADLGQTYNSSVTVQHINDTIAAEPQENAPAFLYHGDFVYADDWVSNDSTADVSIFNTFQVKWDTWGRLTAPIAETMPLMTCVGNHEIEIQSTTTDTVFASVLSRYTVPFTESNSTQPFFYSFDYGPAHVISIAPYVSPNYKQNSPQYQWLFNDLNSVNSPWYSSYSGSFKQMECFRIVYEPLLYQYGVDVIFNGHVHAYERSYPANNWLYDECGTVSITVGDGGNIEGVSNTFVDEPGECKALSSGLYYFPQACPTYNFNGNLSGYCPESQPAISAFREPSFGFGTFDLLNSTHGLYQWRANQNGASVVSDAAYIVRNPVACPNKNISPVKYSGGEQISWFQPAYNPHSIGGVYSNGLPIGYGSVTQGGPVNSSVVPVDMAAPGFTASA